MIFGNSQEKTCPLKKFYIWRYHENRGLRAKADLIFYWPVKTYHSEDLFKKNENLVNEGQIVISIMAGVTHKSMQDG